MSVTATMRLKKDYQKLLKEPLPFMKAAPLESNILEWRYIIFGAPNTPYEGGIYHGKLIFPTDFPFKPPSIIMITPNGRFQTNTRLCLSISDYHPDTWNPAWTVSTIITGLMSFMNDNQPTLGSLSTSDEERRLLARRSHAFNVKDKIFCQLFPEEADKIKKQLAELSAMDKASLQEQEEKIKTKKRESSSGYSSFISNLIIIAGVVALAFAVYLCSVISICTICTLIISRSCSNVGDTNTNNAALISKKPEKKFDETYLHIAILSAPNEKERRNIARRTWLALTSKGPTVFLHRFPIGVVGLSDSEIEELKKEQEEYGDIAILNGLEEGYANLARKTLTTFVNAFENIKFQYMLKVDVDSFVRLTPLLVALKSVQHPMLYWGFLDGRARPFRKGKWREPEWNLCDRYLPYQLGGGYVLSYELVKFLAVNSRLFRLYKNEDVSVGAWLAGLDVKYVHDPRFDTEWTSRGCNNEYLITHKKTDAEMFEMYNNLIENRKLCVKEYQKRPSYVYDFSKPPSECCARLNGSRIP
ncbi:unnamed protein product [Caenorhabditis bovis]|uniref:Ubiquitin-conjugating enzyme E2 J2 n=1 Tax=Caenorhabditis bovis TaxID=2654633 RepID=A0A8S1EWW4_9PELO|nr:unnamed protein product [Caenorhabditis bovis]